MPFRDQYAIDVLKIKHVVVCGHYQCGGVNAVLEGDPLGLVDNWIRHIYDVYLKYEQDLVQINDATKKAARLSEFNVLEQVKNVANTPILKSAWQRGQPVTVHGFIFELTSGLLKNMEIDITSGEDIDHISLG